MATRGSGTDRLSLLADVLAVGKDSRLYRRLVYQDQIATSVSGLGAEIGRRTRRS